MTTTDRHAVAVSIIIPCWNQADYTEACLKALEATTPHATNFEVVLVDNGSTDRTPLLIASQGGDVHVIRNDANLGFARACNQGVRAARGNYLVFLHNDTVPHAGWLEPLVAALDSDAELGAAGSLLLYPDGRVQHGGIGFWPNCIPEHWRHGAILAEHPTVLDARDVQMVTAACMAIRREIFEACGGFDESYVNGCEDVDLCLKVRAHGWKIRYEPASVLTHAEGVSEGRKDRDVDNGMLLLSRWSDRVLPDMRRFDLLAKAEAPKFSVVMTTLDDGATMDDCLAALIGCLDDHDEIVVMDRGSKDGTLDILAAWMKADNRVTAAALEGSGDREMALDAALRRTSGEAILVVRPTTTPCKRWFGAMRELMAGAGIGAVSAGPDAVEDPDLDGACVLIDRKVLERVGLFGRDPFTGIEHLRDRLEVAGLAVVNAVLAEASGQTATEVPSTGEGRGDLGGPRPTTFRIPSVGDWESALAAFYDAFDPHDDVELELCVQGAEQVAQRQEQLTAWLGRHGCAEGTRAIRVLGADGGDPGDRDLVHLDGAVRRPWHLPRNTPELMRQAAGLPVRSRSCGLTSIVILTLNQLEFTVSCFDSINEYTPEPFELIVVDNGSSDDTKTFLREFARTRDNVQLVFNSENTGFAGGCSQGMALARGEYVLLLNNDVIVTPGWLTRMLRPFEIDPGIGIVGPRSNCVSGEQLVLAVPYEDQREMHDYARLRARKTAGQGWYTPIVIGFALLLRTKVMQEIGGLDTRFGRGNFEDDDFCLRAQLSGWKVWVADDAFIHHFGSRTFIGEKIDYTSQIDRNKAIFREKWHLEKLLEDRPDIDSLVGELRGKFAPEELYVPLPDPATVPLVVDNIAVEDLEDHNLLLDADWDGPADVWLPAIEAFAATFSAQDPVALVVAGATELALERIAAVLDARGDDAPDVLSIEAEHQGTAGLVKICQGVVAAHPGRGDEIRHLARIFGKPVFDDLEESTLRTWPNPGVTLV